MGMASFASVSLQVLNVAGVFLIKSYFGYFILFFASRFGATLQKILHYDHYQLIVKIV